MSLNEVLSTLCATAGLLALAPVAFHRHQPRDPFRCISETGLFAASKVRDIPHMPSRPAGAIEPTRPWPRKALPPMAAPAPPVLTEMPDEPAEPPAPLNLELDLPAAEPPAPLNLDLPEDELEPLVPTTLAFRRSTGRTTERAGTATLAMLDVRRGWRKRRFGPLAESELLSAWLVVHYPRRLNDLASRKPLLPVLWIKEQAVPRCDVAPSELLNLAGQLGLLPCPNLKRGRLASYEVKPVAVTFA